MKELFKRLWRITGDSKSFLSSRIPYLSMCCYCQSLSAGSVLHHCHFKKENFCGNKLIIRLFNCILINSACHSQNVDKEYGYEVSFTNSKSRTRRPVISIDAGVSRICNTFATADHYRFACVQVWIVEYNIYR